MTIKALPFALLFLLPLAGCMEEEPLTFRSGVNVDVDVSVDEDTANAEACVWTCSLCVPGQLCAQVCQSFGTCNDVCQIHMECVDGSHWDAKQCSCVLDDEPGVVPCGASNFCGVGEVCCNASCGICTEPGDACTQQACPIVPPVPVEECGDLVCPPGTECCNDSCGICVPPGGACTQQYCG